MIFIQSTLTKKWEKMYYYIPFLHFFEVHTEKRTFLNKIKQYGTSKTERIEVIPENTYEI